MMSGLMLIFIFVSGVSCGCIIGVNSSRDVAADEILICHGEQTLRRAVVSETRVAVRMSPSGIRGICHSMTPELVTAGITEESTWPHGPI